MAFAVEFQTGPAPGRRLRVDADQPRSLRVLANGQDSGHLLFEVRDGFLAVTNRSGRTLMVNQQTVESALLAVGDQVMIGKDVAVVVAIEDAAAATTDSQRRRRAISAEAPVAPTSTSGRQGLITRVSTALATRAERGREEELQRQRLDLLAQVGRRALDGDRFGIPPAAVNDLLTGRPVRLHPGDVDREAVEWWRQARDRLALIDAEIAILRKVIGLPPDPGATAAPVGRRDLHQQEERTFEALDQLATQDLEPLAPPDPPPVRRRTPPLRPHR